MGGCLGSIMRKVPRGTWGRWKVSFVNMVRIRGAEFKCRSEMLIGDEKLPGLSENNRAVCRRKECFSD